MTWENAPAGVSDPVLATFTRNIAGVITDQSSGGLARKWEYDARGRVTSTHVRYNGGGFMFSENMVYSDQNEMLELDVMRANLSAVPWEVSVRP